MDEQERYRKEHLRTWREVLEYNEQLCSSKRIWIFRGQSCAAWDLKTSLERATERFQIDSARLPQVEKGLLREFKRHVHRYVTGPPKAGELAEWLALMQHYGAPTRLLDWTYSFFVAVFFAIEKAKPGQCCAVWMLDCDCLRERIKACCTGRDLDLIRLDPDLKRQKTLKALLEGNAKAVFRLNPMRLNPRLVSQQGVFLVPTDVKRPFMENVQGMFGSDDSPEGFRKAVVHVDHPLLEDVILRLHRMNISRATLFPDLDGFAASLENKIIIPEAIVPKGLEA